MKSIGIIPSRYASTRFYGKPLADISGKTMIQRVYEQAVKSNLLDEVIVATDDDRIFKSVNSFGGKVIMTSTKHTNGTSRCNEVVALLEKNNQHFDIVVNIQGDEPYINPKQIDSVVSILKTKGTEIGTLAKKITSNDELFDSNVVKVVVNNNNCAVYFSRHAIPFMRGVEKTDWLNNFGFLKHIGIYGFKTKTLKAISLLSKSKLEQAESLEQLRWLENNINISVKITDFESVAIDTKDDLLKLVTNL